MTWTWPRGQPIVSLASRVKYLTLALDAKSSALTLTSGKCFQFLFWVLNPKAYIALRLCHHADPWKAVQHGSQFTVLHSLFERIFCTFATSAPVERVLSQSGLFMRPHRMGGRDAVEPRILELQ